MKNKTSAVILAGGEGKRMRSYLPKVLSEVMFKPMLRWVIDAVKDSGIDDICVVTGSKREFVEEYIENLPFTVETVFQSERLGTGHAVMQAEEFLKRHSGSDVLILNGDAPFISVETIKDAFATHYQSADSNNLARGCTVISAEVADPKGYGRIIRETEQGSTHMLKAIVEEKEATDEIRAIKEVNSGAYWFETDSLIESLGKLTKSALTGEYYLTDTIEIIKDSGRAVLAHKAKNADSVLGANDCVQLEMLNNIARERILLQHMRNGVNIPCRDGIMIGCDCEIGANTVILPSTVIRGNTKIGCFCEIGPAAYLDGCSISDGTCIRNEFVKNKTI